MSTCMVPGEAAGAAAFMSLHEKILLRELDAQLLRWQGAAVDEAGIAALSGCRSEE